MTVDHQRPSTARLDELIKMLEQIMLPELKQYRALCAELENRNGHEKQQTIREHQQSYVHLAIEVLQEIGKPTPISVLLERIRERRNDPTITRGSVETSLLRYLSTKGDKTEFVKPSRGTYVHRQFFTHCG